MSVPGSLERFSMAEQVVLVTGASRGIGRALALGFAGAGARVAVNYNAHRDEALEVVAQIERETGRSAIAVQADVGDPDAVRELVGVVEEELGPVDALVCNAGFGSAPTALELDLAEWRRVLRVNLDGPFLCAREVVRRHMAPRRSGSIVVIGSIAGSVAANRTPGGSAYYAAKGGVQMLARGLAIEWVGLGIRVNTLCPGYVATAIFGDGFGPGHPDYDAAVRDTPMGRLGTPDDLVGAALFLASPASAFMTGQTITVDGGFTAW
jgi:NAD(P)-dependent dehydrogenase (short-subunit alcohol dehydrogenase family)